MDLKVVRGTDGIEHSKKVVRCGTSIAWTHEADSNDNADAKYRAPTTCWYSNCWVNIIERFLYVSAKKSRIQMPFREAFVSGMVVKYGVIREVISLPRRL